MKKSIGIFTLVHIFSIFTILVVASSGVFEETGIFVLIAYIFLALFLSLYFFLKKENHKGWGNLLALALVFGIGCIIFLIILANFGYVK